VKMRPTGPLSVPGCGLPERRVGLARRVPAICRDRGRGRVASCDTTVAHPRVARVARRTRPVPPCPSRGNGQDDSELQLRRVRVRTRRWSRPGPCVEAQRSGPRSVFH
jgi:hypothetical protein